MWYASWCVITKTWEIMEREGQIRLRKTPPLRTGTPAFLPPSVNASTLPSVIVIDTTSGKHQPFMDHRLRYSLKATLVPVLNVYAPHLPRYHCINQQMSLGSQSTLPFPEAGEQHRCWLPKWVVGSLKIWTKLLFSLPWFPSLFIFFTLPSCSSLTSSLPLSLFFQMPPKL